MRRLLRAAFISGNTVHAYVGTKYTYGKQWYLHIDKIPSLTKLIKLLITNSEHFIISTSPSFITRGLLQGLSRETWDEEHYINHKLRIIVIVLREYEPSFCRYGAEVAPQLACSAVYSSPFSMQWSVRSRALYIRRGSTHTEYLLVPSMVHSTV